MSQREIPLWEFLKREGEKRLQASGVESFAISPSTERGETFVSAAFSASSVSGAELYQAKSGGWGVNLIFSDAAIAAGAPPGDRDT